MKNLFVGNLSFQITETELRTLFEPFGQVRRAHIATDRETGRARGFAFVEMANDEEAAKAIAAVNGKDVGGRILKVNEARPRTERAAAGFGRSAGDRGPSSGGRKRSGFSTEDYRGEARQPREPRW
jgi:cold-inducible RNA-binding protein